MVVPQGFSPLGQSLNSDGVHSVSKSTMETAALHNTESFVVSNDAKLIMVLLLLVLSVVQLIIWMVY